VAETQVKGLPQRLGGGVSEPLPAIKGILRGAAARKTVTGRSTGKANPAITSAARCIRGLHLDLRAHGYPVAGLNGFEDCHHAAIEGARVKCRLGPALGAAPPCRTGPGGPQGLGSE